jgi:hypothetical protein
MRRLSLPFFLLSLVVLDDGLAVDAALKKAAVYGTSNANLRGGPEVEPPSTAILKGGDQLTVDRLEGEWYLVAAADGQKGYGHKNLVRIAGEAPAQSTSAGPVAAKPVAETNEPTKVDNPAVPTPAGQADLPATKTQPPQPTTAARLAAAKSSAPATTPPREQNSSSSKFPSLIQLLEGREADIALWLAIAVAFFFIGWICGGNYYVRRERHRRTKLRF